MHGAETCRVVLRIRVEDIETHSTSSDEVSLGLKPRTPRHLNSCCTRRFQHLNPRTDVSNHDSWLRLP